ncbi:MAG: hypothetical protein RLZZ526_268 [Actinomycetota bacterium]
MLDGRKCVAAVAALVLCVSCTGTGGDSSPQPTSTRGIVASLVSHCTDIVADDLGDGTLCVDSGFRTDVDQFRFANWGRSPEADMNVTIQTLVDLFGHSAVCMPGPETACILRPRTVQKLDEWNVALGGGRCEGIATMSQRMHLRYETADEYSATATTASQLDSSNARLAQAIVYWWATQFVPEVARSAADSRRRTPLELVDELIRGLANGAGHTVGLYYAGRGHSVTPFAVTRRGGDFVIHTYDNNQPGVRAEIVVSGTTDTWTFRPGTSGEESVVQWHGGTGTLELTPMAARQGPFTCPFCDDPAPNEATTITVANQADAPPNRLMIDGGDAGTIEETDTGFVVGIDGATVERTKTGITSAVTVTVPSSVTSLAVELRHTRDQSTEAVVTVRRAGMADIQVRNARSTALVGAARVTAPLLTVSPGSTTVSARVTDTVVSLAGATNLASVTVARDDSLVVSPIGDDTVEISYKGTAGTSTQTVALRPSGAVTTELVLSKGTLDSWSRAPTARSVRPARTTRSSPLPSVASTQAPTTTVPTIEVTLPG